MNDNFDLAKPTREFFMFGEGAASSSPVWVFLCGRNKGGTDWNIAALKDNAGVAGCSAYPLIDHLLGDGNVYAPRPSQFNAKICRPEELTEVYQGIIDLSNEEINTSLKGVRILRGVDADGCEIKRGERIMVASADCPTVIVRSRRTGRVVAAHAGRDCLFDRKRLESGALQRTPESVIDAIMQSETFWREKDVCEIEAFITCGIGPQNFRHRTDHPTYGKMNEKIVSHFERLGNHNNRETIAGPRHLGCLNLAEIIRAQFMAHGVPPENVADDGIDTYGDMDADDEYTWHSSARGKTPEEKSRRNLVVVVNHGS